MLFTLITKLHTYSGAIIRNWIMDVIIGCMIVFTWIVVGAIIDVNILVVTSPNRVQLGNAVKMAVTDVRQRVRSSMNIETSIVQSESPLELVNLACEHNSSRRWSAIIDVTASDGNCVLSDLAFYLDVPYVSIGPNTCINPVVTIRPPHDTFIRAATAVFLSQNGTQDTLVVLHDDSFGYGVLIPNEMNDIIIDSYLFRLEPDKEYIRKLLEKITNQTSANNFLVLAEKTVIEQVLNEAWDLNMLTSLYHWFFASRDLQDIACEKCTFGSSVVHVHPIVENQPIYSNLRRDTKGTDILNVIYAYDSTVLVVDTIHKLIQRGLWKQNNEELDCKNLNNTKKSEIFHAFQKNLVVVDGILGPVKFLQNSVNNEYANIAIDRIDFGVPQHSVKQIGTWNPIDREKITDSSLFQHVINARLRVYTLKDEPFVFKTITRNGSVQWSGYSISVLKELSKRMHFDYDIYEPEDGQYGEIKPDGKWTGLIGALESRSADMVVGPLSVTSEREGYVDFSIPYYDFAGIQIMMAKPKQDTNLMRFLTVFTPNVWLCNVAVLAVVSLLVYSFDRCSPFSYQNHKEAYPEGGKVFTMKESFWFVMGSYTAAGECYAPRASSARLLVAGFWFFSTIMMSMYTANLAAFNTVSRLAVSIKSLDDLTKQTKINYSVVAGSESQTYFKRMAGIESNFYGMWKDISLRREASASELAKFAVWEYPLGEKYTDILKTMNRTGFLTSSDEGLRKVNEGNFAFLFDTPMVKYETAKSCSLLQVGDSFSSKPYGIGMQQNSPLVKKVNEQILNLQKERFLENMKTEWWNKGRKNCPVEDSNTGVTMASLGGVFIFMAVGLVIGLLALLIEVMLFKYKNRKRTTIAKLIVRPASAHEDVFNTKTEFVSMVYSGNNFQPTVYSRNDKIDGINT